jgi:hypothetical protein
MFAHLEFTLLFIAFFALSILLFLMTLIAHQSGFMNKIILTILSILVITGCAGIDQPVAKVALVTPSLHKLEPLPRSILDVLERKSTADVDGNFSDSNMSSVSSNYKVAPIFYSARGQLCRFLSDDITRQLYCKYAGGAWFAVPSVLSDMQALDQALAAPLSTQSEKGEGND